MKSTTNTRRCWPQAAIQGLNQKVESENLGLPAELQQRDADLSQLRERLRRLEQALANKEFD